MNVSTLNLKELKAVALENNIEVIGNKSYKATYITAITSHFEALKSFAIEANTEALEITEMSIDEVKETSQESLEVFGLLVFSVVNQMIEVLKSEDAKKVYQSVGKFIIISFILAFFYTRKVIKYVLNLSKFKTFYMTTFYILAMGISGIITNFEEGFNYISTNNKNTVVPYLEVFK